MDANSTTADIAREIFNEFEINQSCTIMGFITIPGKAEVKPKGEVVLECLRELDAIQNSYVDPKGKTRRKRVQLENTIGGYVAQKIFKHKNEKRGDNIVYKIWRIQ